LKEVIKILWWSGLVRCFSGLPDPCSPVLVFLSGEQGYLKIKEDILKMKKKNQED